MKGRMFVVNEATLKDTQKNNIVSVFAPDTICDPDPKVGKQWLKTLADIMADMLQVEIGDYIFLWETSDNNKKSRIHGVYRAISKPYYQCNSTSDKAPFKIKVEKAYDFENALDEYDVLNCPYIKDSLWTIIGKKVAGKSRGTSPLSIMEIKHLITLLIGKNPNYKFYKKDLSRVVKVSNELQINYANKGVNVKPTSLLSLKPNNLNYLNTNSNVHYEKILETILNQEMANRNASFFSQIGVDVSKVLWYSNYLPYSIEQSEMDYVIIESEDGINISKIFVIELQAKQIDDDHMHRCLMYSKWVNETLALGTGIAQPILICPKSYDFIKGEKNKVSQRCLTDLNNTAQKYESLYGVKPLEVYEYSFEKTPTFTKKR